MSIDYLFEVIFAYAPLLSVFVPYFCAGCGILAAISVLYHVIGALK